MVFMVSYRSEVIPCGGDIAIKNVHTQRWECCVEVCCIDEACCTSEVCCTDEGCSTGEVCCTGEVCGMDEVCGIGEVCGMSEVCTMSEVCGIGEVCCTDGVHCCMCTVCGTKSWRKNFIILISLSFLAFLVVLLASHVSHQEQVECPSGQFLVSLSTSMPLLCLLQLSAL